MQRLSQYLTATGRRLSSLAAIIAHLFRKGKFGLKVAVKIPFFVDVEFSVETEWGKGP